MFVGCQSRFGQSGVYFLRLVKPRYENLSVSTFELLSCPHRSQESQRSRFTKQAITPSVIITEALSDPETADPLLSKNSTHKGSTVS